MKTKLICLMSLPLACSAIAQGELRVTEVLYTGVFGEFFEVTNVAPNAGGGANDVDVTGFTFINSDPVPTPVPFPSLMLKPGESIIFTEADEIFFDIAWYKLPQGIASPVRPASLVAVVSNVTENLNRSDSITLVDDLGFDIEALNFTDQNAETVFPTPGPDFRKDVGVRSEEISAVPNVLPGNPIPFNRFSIWLLSSGYNAGNTNVGLPAGSATPWKAGFPLNYGSLGSPGIYIR